MAVRRLSGGSRVGFVGLLVPTEPVEQVCPRGVEQVVTLEALQVVDRGQRPFGPLDLADRDRSIHRNDRRRLGREQVVVEPDYLRSVGWR